jgi:GT2 family glycosyltransferase
MIQVVFANYGCGEAIESAVRSLARCDESRSVEVVIVENGGTPVDVSSLLELGLQSVETINAKQNVGYFGAMRLAWESTSEREFDYRILCNPDIEFVQTNFVRTMLSLPKASNIAAIAPSVLSLRSGVDQNPYLANVPSRFQRWWWRMLYASFHVYKLRCALGERVRSARQDRVEECTIYAPHGSIMIFSPLFFELQRSFDSMPFLYAEELFVGEMIRRAGWIVSYVPGLQVAHKENVVTGLLPSRQRFEMQRAAMNAFLRYQSGPQ